MRREPLGSAASWARDFAILGFLSALIVPLSGVTLVVGPSHLGQVIDGLSMYFVAAALLGAFSGLVFGFLLRGFLLRFPAVPLGLLLLIVPLLGAGLGAVVGWGVAPLARPEYSNTDGPATILGAVSAGLQIMWFWPLYLRCRVTTNTRSTAALLCVAIVTAVVLGPLVVWLVP